MIRVLQMSTALDGGGVERFLLNYYSNIDTSKVKFDVIVPGAKKGLIEDDFIALGASIHHVTKLHDDFFVGIKEIKNIIKNGNYDIIHCHGNKSSLLGLIFGKIFGVRVRIVHAHMTEETINRFKKSYKLFSKIVINIFANEKFACGIDAGKYLFGLDKKDDIDFYVINNAIDLNNFLFNNETRTMIRDKYKVNENSILIGNIARFSYQKNHDLLIDIFYELKKQNDTYILFLIGNGELVNHIKAKCEKLNLIDDVRFLGSINNVNEILSALDIGILTSRYEGLPVVLVEMQAAGLNCLCSKKITEEVNVTNNIIYIEDYENIDLWSKSIRSFNINDSKKRIGINENMRNGKYDIQKQSDYLLELYEKLISEHK